MKVFDYVVFFTPTPEEKKAGEKAKIIATDRILEVDQKAAELKVARQIPAEYDDKLDQVTIAIRPF